MTAISERVTTNDLMREIVRIAPSASMKFSPYTLQWYVEAPIEISDGELLTSVSEHRDTPEEAIRAFMARLVLMPPEHVIVTKAYTDDRRHWRWTGFEFTERPLEAGGSNGTS